MIRPMRLALMTLLLAAAAAQPMAQPRSGPGAAAASADAASAVPLPGEAPWEIAGRQGVITHVIVPAASARDRGAYLRQIPWICARRETCFVNFYTNSTGTPVAVPLPEAIAAETTAVLRRSAKQGAEALRFSCRLGLPDIDCF